MTNSELLDLERIGRIVVEIKLYKRQCVDSQTDRQVSTYLKANLSTEDYLFWQTVQQTFIDAV